MDIFHKHFNCGWHHVAEGSGKVPHKDSITITTGDISKSQVRSSCGFSCVWSKSAQMLPSDNCTGQMCLLDFEVHWMFWRKDMSYNLTVSVSPRGTWRFIKHIQGWKNKKECMKGTKECLF